MKNAREVIDARLATRPRVIGKDSRELERMANLLLEESFTKKLGILAPSKNQAGLTGGRLQDNTFDPRIGLYREAPFDLSGSGVFDISMQTGNLIRGESE